MAVSDRTLQILPGGQSAAPFSYVLPASTSFDLLAVRATFDGTAAASYLPCVQLVSDSGVVMAQSVGSAVAAGGSADVTFAPFLESVTTSGGTGGSFVGQLTIYTVAGAYSYAVPATAILVEATMLGSGGGGGGGSTTFPPNNGSGGAAGGGGAIVSERWLPANIPALVPVVVAAGGAGGAGAAAGLSHTGFDGSNGAASSFNGLTAGGGGFGQGGNSPGNSVGGGGGGSAGSANGSTPGLPPGGSINGAIAGQGAPGLAISVQGVPAEYGGGAATKPTSSTLAYGTGGDSLHGGPAGGCGGGWNGDVAIQNAAAGGGPGFYFDGHGAAGGVSGNPPTAGAPGTQTGMLPGTAGGGGGASTGATAGANGGAGAAGAGGGGGGMSSGGGVGGTGGKGGDGLVYVVAWVPA